MLSTFPQLAFSQREPKIIANTPNKHTSTEAPDRAWQNVPQHKRTVKLERSYKGYHISLLHVATGAYKTYDTTSTVNPDTSSCASNAPTLYTVHASEQEQLIDIKIEDAISQDNTITAGALSGTIESPQALHYPGHPSRVCSDKFKTTRDLREDHVVHRAQGSTSLGELEARLFPEQYAVKAKGSTNTAMISLAQPISIGDIKKKAAILDESKLPQHLDILNQAEEEFQELHSALEATSAPINNYMLFGVLFSEGDNLRDQIADGVTFDLTLYRAIWAAKLDLGIAEFDPTSLVDGKVAPNTNEADVLEDLPRELREGFMVYLEHLARLKDFTRHKEWKPRYRFDRDEAELLDNVFLEGLLKQDDPRLPVPFGRNPLIQEYWY